MRFDAPLVLYLAPVACMMLWGFAIWARARRIGAASRWSDELGAHARAAGWLGTLIIAGAGLIATLGVAGPRWGSRTVVTEAKALNLVLAVDISRSMLAEDEHPSRLEKAKTAASRLVHDLSGDRVGLIAFAGESFVLSPLTQDGGALQLLIEGLHPDMSSAAGTQLQRAIRSARSLLVGEGELADRVLVIFSDGETHDSVDAVQAEASRARREGIKVILVAEGRTEPARIPMYTPDGELSGYYRDENLDFVLTSRRDDILTTVADASQGALVAAEVSDQARTVRSLVEDLKRTPHATTSSDQGISRAWIAALVAASILLLQALSRRSATLVAIAWILFPVTSDAQGPGNPADWLWPDSPGAAATAYLRQAMSGEGSDTTWFNAGAAALAAGDTALARRALTAASRSVDPDVRFKSLFNLGLLYHRLAVQGAAESGAYFQQAREAYREALLLDPGNLDAKWNYELAIERRPPNDQDGDGLPDRPQPPEGDEASESELSASQAEQILNSILEEERRTRDRLNRQRQYNRDILRGKSW